jgi:hypothetical protein
MTDRKVEIVYEDYKGEFQSEEFSVREDTLREVLRLLDGGV